MEKKTSKYYETARLMDEALLALLEKKDFAFITIKEICAKAGVNRSTFYLHYENTSDLLAETISMIGDRFYESFQNRDAILAEGAAGESFFITPDYLIPYLEFVKENKKIFSLIHKKPELFRSRKVFDRMYAELFSPILDKYHDFCPVNSHRQVLLRSPTILVGQYFSNSGPSLSQPYISEL